MKRLLFVLLSTLSLFTAHAQTINFTGDTTQRVNGRYRIAFPGGTPYVVPPVGGGAATPISVSAGVASVNNQSGAVTINYGNLPGKPTTVAASGLTDAATTAQVNAKEPTISAGTAAQYWRGDKTFQPLNSAAVGLGNLANSLQVINAGGVISQQSGTQAAMPAAGTNGRVYQATDVQAVFFDNGSSWQLQSPAFSGDATKPVGSTAITLATVNSNVGTFGAANVVPVPTVNAKGLVTGVSSQTITPQAIGASATKDFVLSAATNGTVLTHNLTTLYGLTSPRMTGVVYQNGQPDYNVYVVRNDDNSVKLVTPLKSDGTNETVTGYVRIWVSQ